MSATIVTLRGPEMVWTCDAEGNWFHETRTRIREGNGWREIISAKRGSEPATSKQGETK